VTDDSLWQVFALGDGSILRMEVPTLDADAPPGSTDRIEIGREDAIRFALRLLNCAKVRLVDDAEQIAAWLEAHFDDDEYQGDYPSTSQRNHDQYKLAAAIREGRWRK
jgi:hypothetical protein